MRSRVFCLKKQGRRFFSFFLFFFLLSVFLSFLPISTATPLPVHSIFDAQANPHGPPAGVGGHRRARGDDGVPRRAQSGRDAAAATAAQRCELRRGDRRRRAGDEAVPSPGPATPRQPSRGLVAVKGVRCEGRGSAMGKGKARSVCDRRCRRRRRV